MTYPLDLVELSASRPLLAASTGGHLTQLYRFAEMIGFNEPPHWITFDHPQSRSLLDGHDVTFVPYIAPRALRRVLSAVPIVRGAVSKYRPDIALSTGAALAGAVLPLTANRNIRSIYIESVSRFDGPSLTGRALGIFPKIERYAQHQTWKSRQWPTAPSILESYRSVELPDDTRNRPLKVFVTLGTIRPYQFQSLIARLKQLLTLDDEVVVQSGVTCFDSSDWDVKDFLEGEQIAQLIDWADVVVTHAGVGSALQILDRGKIPILAVRRSARGEHVDDHQSQIAHFLIDNGLALGGEVPKISREDLLRARRRRVVSSKEQPL